MHYDAKWARANPHFAFADILLTPHSMRAIPREKQPSVSSAKDLQRYIVETADNNMTTAIDARVGHKRTSRRMSARRRSDMAMKVSLYTGGKKPLLLARR